MMFNDFENAMQLIASGELEEAITALENICWMIRKTQMFCVTWVGVSLIMPLAFC
jgi:hypothetical protein